MSHLPPKPKLEDDDPIPVRVSRYGPHYGALAGFLFWCVALGFALSRIFLLSFLGKLIVWPFPMLGFLYIWGDNEPPAMWLIYNPFLNGAISLCLYVWLGAVLGTVYGPPALADEVRSKPG